MFCFDSYFTVFMTRELALILVVIYGSIVGYGRIKRAFFPQIHICEAHAMAATREDNV